MKEFRISRGVSIIYLDLMWLVSHMLGSAICLSPLAGRGYTGWNGGASWSGGTIFGIRLMHGPGTLVGGMWQPGWG